MIMRDLPQPREAYIHIQGNFTRKGDPVSPGALSVLPPLPKSENPNRLDLARWLVSKDNPLTPRVTVNRIWQRYFGLGIVETENDFGSQGTPPSHPRLLDWLASEFVRRDWSLKAMHRLIVNSATYRQSSEARPEAQKIDPSNRLLARQNRIRAGGGDDSRLGSGRVGFADCQDRRSQRLSATAAWRGSIHPSRPPVESG